MRRRSRPSKRRPLPSGGPASQATIPVDVRELRDEFVVSADVPGIRKQDIDVQVKKNRVRIQVAPAERETDESPREGPFAKRARKRRPVSRVVHLPAWVNEKRTDAEYVDGVLRITLPKRERRHRVDVE